MNGFQKTSLYEFQTNENFDTFEVNTAL